MSSKRTLALLYGGKSGEHEISLLSSASVFKAIDKSRYEVIPIGCDKQGRWYVNSAADVLSADNLSLKVVADSSKPVPLSTALFEKIDVVFPVMHGPLYEDGCLQGFFEFCDTAYVGCGHLSSAVAMDKVFAKQLALSVGVKTADFICLKSTQSKIEQEFKLDAFIKTHGLPLFVKPACLGSSVGISRASSHETLLAAVEVAFKYDDKIMVERAVCGREIELAVLTVGGETKVSIAGEIAFNQPEGFYSYEAKYLEKTSVDLRVPAMLKHDELQALRDAATKVFDGLDCEGLARVDFFVEDTTSEIIFNEINTLPGFTQISMYPKLWEASGVSYTDLLNGLIEAAMCRFDRRHQLVRDYS